MGKATGFLEYQRMNPKKRPPEERIKDWDELRLPQDPEDLKIQGARCMNCGIPFCHGSALLNGMAAGCPLQNLIPEWNELVYKGQWQEAYKRLIRTNPFPEFTGRVCPAPCEGSCTEGYIMESVAINSLEYEIIERAFKEGWVVPPKAKPTGKKVAVVGSGPSGMSAAYYLNVVGHEVTVFERNDRPGGLMMYGIPNMKLDKSFVERRIELMKASGIQFILNTEVGKDIPAQELVDKYDAVVLCAGATKARGLDVEGKDLKGVYFAVDFLKATTKSLLDSKLEDGNYISAKGKNVIIIGGGDTGTDCVATSIRHGCESVHQFEIMPEPPEKRNEETNPWPEWPLKLKVDYGQEEAISLYGKDPRNYLISTKKIIGNEQGEVKEVHTVQITWVKNEAGRMIPQEVPGSEKVWKADLVLLAMGFLGPEDTIPSELELERDPRSNVKADYKVFETNVEKVFAAGDMRRGQSLIVWAINEGKLAAREVDKYLMGKSVIK
ncbi:NADH/NADPH-dependent glutamate synthase small subunit [Desulfosporosinus orientis DSM 765]|uniref:NADH/NADPH-dependent glutamate synthase small subunit n=1 Tax=Desulfosporosinus orientis (strain ATCC 19365 / DSM 765 / NCIMB 8382 / VKM B-1628 / Singapore I) TaxID=768706 RepID=G7WEX1_DESOD|nr:glutamate synthase subunit beta [Desulfosporosinus orientis]AET67300.1 NADH/NADPH-dependent glutamate synthase small subunit [Desulfosporosinus orientis DSM 765]